MSASFLAETQKRLRRLIAWPEGVVPALLEESPGAEPLEAVVTSDDRLPAEQRLGVYANAYFYRIHDVLAEDFPTLATLLGADDFHDLATSYLAVCPSRHFSLRYVGDQLAAFLESHAAAESLRARFPWAADLARFEAAAEDAFDAADSEAARREDLVALAPEAWDALPIALRPGVQLLRLGFKVHEARRALREGRPAAEPLPQALQLCLWRRDEQVVWRELDPHEAHALKAAVQPGIAFGALCERIAERAGAQDAALQAATWLATWVEAGLIRQPTG